VIDFRTAFRSHALFDALARLSPNKVDPARALTHTSEGAALPPKSLDEHVERWQALLDKHRVAHAVALAGCDEEVEVLAEGAERSHGRLVAFAPIDPTAAGAADRVARLFATRRFAGAVLSPAVHGYRISDPSVAPVLDALEDHGVVVVVQCGLPFRDLERAFGVHRPFHAELSNPLDLLAPAERRPNLALVVPHFGSGYLRELLMLASHCPNVCTDTSHALSGLSAQTAKLSVTDLLLRALDVLGPSRVLFGTGSDNPGRWKHEVLLQQREALGACGLSEEESALVFDGNARRLLGLPVPEPQAIPQTH
jgi:hypothetical protein